MRMNWLRGLAAAMLGLAMAGTAAAQTPPKATVEKINVHGASIEGNLEGNSADREVFVVLPPSYAKSPKRRYPVVYFLHGFTATAQRYMDGTRLAEGFEKAVAKGPEFILVVPDSYTRHGGSMYSNSPTVGNFEGFIAHDLVAYIDSHYRTIAKRESRGLSGHSMGGYGTLKIGMKYPQVFSSLYAMSACCLSARTTTPERAKALETSTLEQALKADFFTKADFASAAAWSPAPDKPPFFLDSGLTKDGTIDPVVLAEWAANAPNAMVPQYLSALRSFKAIAIDIGDKDFLLADDTALHEELKRFGIAHEWTLYEGDHGNRIADRFRDFVLPFFQKNLAAK